ncbi:MAG: hypothetical protein JRH20_07765 [Deltaproteobacteria bacterium]|nr:hypothetical protein [Deltaproteobacteria bacterium]
MRYTSAMWIAFLSVLLLAGCQWLAGYDGTRSPGALDSAQTRDVGIDGAHLDGASDVRVDGGRDDGRADVSRDVSGDMGRADASVDISSDVDARDGAVDLMVRETTVDAFGPSWVVQEFTSFSPGWLKPKAVAIDSTGRIAVGGEYSGEVLFPGGILFCPQRCPFVILGTANANVSSFSVLFDPRSAGVVQDLAFDANDRLLVGGNFSEELTVNTSTIDKTLVAQGVDSFLLRVDPASPEGFVIDWFRHIKGDGVDRVLAVATHPSVADRYAVGGSFTSPNVVSLDVLAGTNDFTPAGAVGTQDGFVMLLSSETTTPPDALPAVATLGGSGDDVVHDVLLTETELLAAGAFNLKLKVGCPAPVVGLGQDGIVAQWYTSGTGLMQAACSKLGGYGEDEARCLLPGSNRDHYQVVGTTSGAGYFGNKSYNTSSGDADLFHGEVLFSQPTAALASQQPGVERALGAALWQGELVTLGTHSGQGVLLQHLDYQSEHTRFAIPSWTEIPSMAVATDAQGVVFVSESVPYGLLPRGRQAGVGTTAFIAVQAAP